MILRKAFSLSTLTLLALYLWERFARMSLEAALEDSERKRATLAKEVLRLEDDLDAARDRATQAEALAEEDSARAEKAEAERDAALSETANWEANTGQAATASGSKQSSKRC